MEKPEPGVGEVTSLPGQKAPSLGRVSTVDRIGLQQPSHIFHQFVQFDRSPA